MSAYRFRTEDCPECNGHKFVTFLDDDGFTGRRCDDCLGGRVDQACSECRTVTTLNDEGLCEKCFDASELPVAEFNAKYTLAFVEVLEPRDGRERRAA